MLTRVGKSCGSSSGSTFRRALQCESIGHGGSLKSGRYALESLSQRQASLAARNNLTNISARQKLVDL